MPKRPVTMVHWDPPCQDPNHPNNSAWPGWTNDPLGSIDLPQGTSPTGYQCPGCQAAAAALASGQTEPPPG